MSNNYHSNIPKSPEHQSGHIDIFHGIVNMRRADGILAARILAEVLEAREARNHGLIIEHVGQWANDRIEAFKNSLREVDLLAHDVTSPHTASATRAVTRFTDGDLHFREVQKVDVGYSESITRQNPAATMPDDEINNQFDGILDANGLGEDRLAEAQKRVDEMFV